MPYVNADFLQLQHTRCLEAALRRFNTVRKMGGDDFSQPYIDQLQTSISDHYANFIKQNEAKNVFSAARTPAVMLACAAIFYILSGMLAIIGLLSLAFLANVLLFAFVGLFAIWAYSRYYGEAREFGQIVDHIADVLWTEVKSLLHCCVKQTVVLVEFLTSWVRR
jgi:atlastin